MIITVTLNTAIDKTLSVPNFKPGRRHRTVEQTTMPGGKGVNVARAIKRLGRPVIATGFAGGATGTRIVEALTAESVLTDFVRIGEECHVVWPAPEFWSRSYESAGCGGRYGASRGSEATPGLIQAAAYSAYVFVGPKEERRISHDGRGGEARPNNRPGGVRRAIDRGLGLS